MTFTFSDPGGKEQTKQEANWTWEEKKNACRQEKTA